MTTAQQVASRVSALREELNCGQDCFLRIVAGELGVVEALAIFKALTICSQSFLIKDDLGDRRLNLDYNADGFTKFYAQLSNRELRDIAICDQLSKSFIIVDGDGLFWLLSGTVSFLERCNLEDAELLKYYVDVMSLNDGDEARVMSVWQELERYM